MKRLLAMVLTASMLFSFFFVDGALMLGVSAAGSYYGMFDDKTSDGGFEYGAWIDEPNQTTATSKSSKEYSSEVYHRGKKSAAFTFGSSKETYAIYMTFDGTEAIDALSDYCWTAWIKTANTNLRNGKVVLKMVEAGKPTDTTNGLKNNKSSVDVTLCSGLRGENDWKRYDSSKDKYIASAISTFLTGKEAVTVVLQVTGKNGTIYVDDIDFKMIEMLDEDEEIEKGDNTGALEGEYSGLFDDNTSDGGFENKAWKKTEGDTVQKYNIYVKNTGKRSSSFVFDGTEKTSTIYTSFDGLTEFDLSQNYCWSAYVKTTDDFDGKVTLKLGAPDSPTGSGILNANQADGCVIYDSAVSEKANKKWKSFNTADAYYTPGSISQLINNTAAVTESGKIGLYITVTASCGTVWLDDIDLQKRAYVLGDDDTVKPGAYEGLFDDKTSNGGFEYGLWEKLEAKTTATGLSKALADTSVAKTGSRSASFVFANNMTESFTLKTTFDDIKDIDKASDYFWKAYFRSGDGFDGIVSFKITEAGKESNALKNKNGNAVSEIYKADTDAGSAAWSAATTVTARYEADKISEFFSGDGVKKNGIDIYITVTAKNGQLWVDDVDFVSYDKAIEGICLDDPDTAYNVTESDYTGFFNEQSSNGGFEYGAWSMVKADSTAKTPSVYYSDTESKRTGKRSLAVNFASGEKEKLVLKMTSYKANELENADYVLSAFIKTANGFNGKASFKLVAKNGTALKNSQGKTETVILDSASYTKFSRNDTSATPFKAAEIEAFKTAAADGFDVYLIIEAAKGEIRIDDIDLLTAAKLEEEKNTVAEGAKYDGIFKNGGFENGVWQASNLANHGVEEDDEVSYNESLKSMKINSSKATGHSGALKLSGETVSGKAAELDSDIKRIVSAVMKTDGSFTGSVYLEFTSGVASTDKYYLIKDSTVTYTDWHPIATPTFNITGDDIKINLYIDGVGTLWLDDVNLDENPDKDNFITNGSFVNGAWSSDGQGNGAKVTTEYDVTCNSATAMRFTGGESGEAYVYTGGKAMKHGTDYKLTVSMKTVDVGLGQAYIMVLYTGAGKSQWAVCRSQEEFLKMGGTTDWQTRSVVLTDVPEWATSYMLYAKIRGTGILFVDNVYLTDKVTADDYKTTQAEGEYDGVLYNGGFEAGHWSFDRVSDQKVSLDTENAHSGKNALKLETFKQLGNRDKAFKISTYTVSDFADGWDLTGNYRIGLYFKSSADFNGSVYVIVTQNGQRKWYNYSTELLLLGTVGQGSTGYDKWTYLYSPNFTIDDSELTVELLIDGVGTVWVDDVDLIPDPEADNFITNGGFESGMWATWGTDSAEGKEAVYVTDVTDGSAKAGRLSSTVDEGEVFVVGTHSKPIDPKKTYTLSFSYKTEGVSENGAYFTLADLYPDANGNTVSTWHKFYGAEAIYLATDKEGWQTFSITCNKWNSELTGIWLYLRLSGAGTVWFDNITLKEKVVDTNIPAGTVGTDTAEGDVEAGTIVRLFTTDEAGDIYYTVDGSNPKTAENVYLYDDIYGINITHNMTIKAYVVAEEAEDGEVASFTYTCDGYVKEDTKLPLVKTQGTVSLDTQNKKSGKNSVKIKGNGSSIYASTGHITLDSAFDYKVEFWVKTEDLLSENTAYVNIFMVGDGGIEYCDTDSQRIKGSYYIDPRSLCEIKTTQDWTHYEFIIGDMNSNWQSFNITAGIANDMGTLWIDGIKITALPYDKHALTVAGDDAVYGNIYTQNTLSSYTINQGFKLVNAANTIETGTMTYEVVNDADPDTVIGTGEFEVGVFGGGSGTYSELLPSIAKYGTYTVKFTMTNSRGKKYSVGDLAVSRIKDASSLTKESLIGVCANAPMNTGITDDTAEEWYATYAKSGLGMLRVDLDWEDVMDDNGNLAIPEIFDRRISIAAEYDIEHIVIFNSHITAKDGGSNFPDTDEEIARFIEYVKFTVNHFKGRVSCYELFNETDLFTNTLIDGAGYARLLKEVYKAIKEIDPEIKLIGGVTSGINYNYLEAIFKAGGGDYMDYVSVHPYVYPESPETAEWKTKIEAVKALADKYSGGKVDIMLTEMGYTTIRTKYGTTEQQKLDYFIRTFVQMKSLDYVKKLTVYTTNSGNNYYMLESMWGLYGSTGSSKLQSVGGMANPVAVGIAAFTNILNGYDFVKEIDYADGLYTYKFSNGKGKDIYVLWTNDVEKSAEITATSAIKVTDIFGNNVSVESKDDTYFQDVGSKVIYVTLDSSESIKSVVLKNKDGSTSDDSQNKNDGTDKSDSNASNDDGEYENSDEYYDESDDGSDTPEQTVKKKRRKVTKVITKGGETDDGMPWWIWLIIGFSALALAAGVTIFIVIFKKKRKKKAEN